MSQSQLQPPRLLEQMRAVIRARHYSLRTEETYLGWVKRFILFHGKRHPRDMGAQEVQQFLSHLAVEGHVAASTQSQALSAILFLYQQVLKHDIGWLHDVVRAKQPQRLPVVLTRDEVAAVLRHLSGTPWIMATLLYGAGLRLMECIRLRVKDIDFAYNQIVVRDGKGQKDRVTMLPQHVKAALQQHLLDVQHLHTQDLDKAVEACTSRTRWSANTPTPITSGCGNMSFLRPRCRATLAQASSGGTISTHWSYSGPYTPLSASQASPSQPVAIAFGTVTTQVG